MHLPAAAEARSLWHFRQEARPVGRRRRLDDGRRRIQYAPTMVMSTYLVAFVVGPLEATEPRISRV